MSSNSTNKPARRLRQAFLPFTPVPQWEVKDEISYQTTTTRAPPELPTEVWSLILPPLPPIVLKSFRLVCRRWAQLGAEWLFSTVYVDTYKESWKKLEQLSRSQYASCVQYVCWHPIFLPEEPLEADAWRACYSNILNGLNIVQSVRLYKAYCRCVKSASRILKGLDLPKFDIDFGRLPNLRNVTLEDDVDAESQCEDAVYRRNIQYDEYMHASVALWGKSPRMWDEDDKNRYQRFEQKLQTFATIFPMLENCLTLSSCTIKLWMQNWRFITSFGVVGQTTWTDIAHPSIKKIRMIFKFCDVKCRVLEEQRLSMDLVLRHAFENMRKVPELEDLEIQPSFTDPGPIFRTLFKQEQHRIAEEEESEHRWDCSEASSCECFTAGDTIAEMSERYDEVPSLLHQYFDSAQIWFQPSIVRTPKLKTLTLHGSTLDVKSLIVWLCEQDTHDIVDLTICLIGDVILHGFNQELFNKLMSSFDVNVVCHGRFLYCETANPLELAAYYTNRQHYRYQDHIENDWECFQLISVDQSLGIQMLAEPCTDPELLIHQGNISSIHHRKTRDRLQVDLIHHPRWINERVSGQLPPHRWRYYYCMSIQPDEVVKFYWISDLHSIENSLRQGMSHVLLVARPVSNGE